MTKEELKKEAEEYALNTYEMCSYSDLPYASDRRAREQAFIAGAEPREKRIAELEKENAELKDYRLTTVAKQQTDMSKYALNLEHKLSWYDNQLTKATELLRKLVLEVKGYEEINGYDTCEPVQEAEQFLKENNTYERIQKAKYNYTD